MENTPFIPAPSKRHVIGLRCAPIPKVRIGLVGLGQRGMRTLERYAFISGAAITCIADINADALAEANDRLARSGRDCARTFAGKDGWQEMCRLRDLDLIYICPDWASHCEMAVEAMRQGKHAAVEVPAATTVEECRLLVETAERTRRHCFMTENCCYDSFALATLQMRNAGLLGTITHCEGAYIHDLRDSFGLTAQSKTDTVRNWMERSCARHRGNPYPTHGMGPIGQLLRLHRKDRLDYLVSLTSHGAGEDGLQSRVNSTLLRTVGGVSILLQLDVTTPRPYSRLQTVCGTKGFVSKYPTPTIQLDGQPLLTGSEALAAMEQHYTSDAALRWLEGRRLNVPNEMNYAMDARLIHCLRYGLPLDIDVYDAAEWSCIAELSEQSAVNGSRPVPVPDFTKE